MPSILLVITTLVAAYSSTFIYCFIRNLINGRKTGIPLILVPIDANWIPWMIGGVAFKQWFQENLPRNIYMRLATTIYGHEFAIKFAVYDKLAAPQGDRKSFILVTAGRLEFWTWDSQIANQILSRPKDFNQFDMGTRIVCS